MVMGNDFHYHYPSPAFWSGACAVTNARRADAVSGYAAGAGGDSTGSGAAY